MSEVSIREGSNRFFESRGHFEEQKKGRVYAAIEVPGLAEEGEVEDARDVEVRRGPILLECVDKDWLDSVLSNQPGSKWSEIFREARISVLELNGYPLPPFSDELGPGDIAWFEFGYAPVSSGENDAMMYGNLFSEGFAVRIDYCEPRSGKGTQGEPLGRGAWLTAELEKQSASKGLQQDVYRTLSKVESGGGVAIYDVGQGACQAALKSGTLIPSIYIDFGGGVLGNAKTFPSGYKGFCFTESPCILLSHWDWDHWSSAHRFPLALDAMWIAPKVPEKPIQQTFAAELFLRGNLRIWSDRFAKDHRGGGLRIERCSGRTINDSGLAVTVYPGIGRRKNCLLPGDANYRFIPSVGASAAFNSLCMTHHGGRLHSNLIPKAKRRAALVCSVGAGNSYKHPFLDTVEAHIQGGWPVPLTTGFAGSRPCHVLVPWDGTAKAFIGGCHGGDVCSVAFI
jgi:hypothetical protein